ncbi:MAG: hypothetical protein KDK71_02695 [Chlamydiia bacterium]|nr:hypothetical protein [Chlamydiia bacterium]
MSFSFTPTPAQGSFRDLPIEMVHNIARHLLPAEAVWLVRLWDKNTNIYVDESFWIEWGETNPHRVTDLFEKAVKSLHQIVTCALLKAKPICYLDFSRFERDSDSTPIEFKVVPVVKTKNTTF